jgi:hypothetical protein
MLRWPALQFPNRQLEASYQASRSRFLLQVDTWHGLLVLAYIPTWLAIGTSSAAPVLARCAHASEVSCQSESRCSYLEIVYVAELVHMHHTHVYLVGWCVYTVREQASKQVLRWQCLACALVGSTCVAV